jgi:hypothetical protein
MKLTSIGKALAISSAIVAGAYTYENRDYIQYSLEDLLSHNPSSVVFVKDNPDILLASNFSSSFSPKFSIDPKIDLAKICCQSVNVPDVSNQIVRKYDWAFNRAIEDNIIRDRIYDIFKVSDDPYLILAVMMQESGLERKPDSLRGCHGSLQIKKDVFEHIQRQARLFYSSGNTRQRKTFQNLKNITWNSVMNNNLEAQIIVFEAYLNLINDILRPKCGKITDHELKILSLESYNLGYNVVTSAIESNSKSKNPKPVTWNSLRYDICSLNNLRKHLGWLGDDSVLSKRREIALAYADSCAYNYSRLKGDTRLVNLIGQYCFKSGYAKSE